MINELIEKITIASGESVTAQSVVEIINGGIRDAVTNVGDAITPGTPAVFESAQTIFHSASALTSTKVLVAYQDIGNSNYGTACILDISTSTITPGTPAVFESASTAYIAVATLSETKAIVSYRDSGNSDYGTACILDVATSTITPATPAVFESAAVFYTSLATLSETKAIVSYRDSGNSDYGTACILDISTSTITPATPAVFESASTASISVATLSETKAIVSYRDEGNSGHGTSCILDISTSTITPGTPAVHNTANSTNSSLATLSETKAIVSYRDSGNSDYGTACILDVATSTITPATPAVFESAAVFYTSLATLGETRAIVSYSDAGNSNYGTSCILDISTSTITPGTPAVFESDATNYITVATLSETKAIVSYQDDANSDYGTACVLDIPKIQPTNAIGISKTTASSGKADISFGQLIGGFTGLTQGAYQYIADDGTLTETPETVTEAVAIAISETAIKWLNPTI